MHLKKELERRWFIKQFSDEKVFDLYNKWGESLYFGIDPTADSLHVGHFTIFMNALNYMLKWNKLIVIVGGATWMIWDPSGKESDRDFLDEKTLQHNVKSIKKQVNKIISNLEKLTGESLDIEVINNYDFYKDMSIIEFLRKAGKNITVNKMLSRDNIKHRIQDDDKSISYTEFSYMLLQWYDFYKLFKDKNVKLQMSGSDQWWNAVTGIELIRKLTGESSYAVTAPLVTTSNGKKFGKSEWNAVWIDEDKNSPYFVYQYFMNTTDQDVEKYLKAFTLLDFDEIEQIVTKHQKNPSQRYWQEKLAEQITTILFGKQKAKQAKDITNILFGDQESISQKLKDMDRSTIKALYNEVWWHKLKKESEWLLNILNQVWLAESNSQARRDIKSWAIYINGEQIKDWRYDIQDKDFINNACLIQRWKKKFKVLIK